MTVIKNITMPFDLKVYREKIKPFQRTCYFSVSCAELPKFEYLAKYVELSSDKGLFLRVVEEDGLSSLKMIKELAEKRYKLTVNFLSSTGELNETLVFNPIDVTYKTTLSWEDLDTILCWDVTVLV